MIGNGPGIPSEIPANTPSQVIGTPRPETTLPVLFHIVIPGTPIGCPRPRFDGRRSRTYMPAWYRTWHASTQRLMRSAWRDREPLRQPVRITLRARFPSPKRPPTRARVGGVVVPHPFPWHIATPDADNVLKAVCDALQPAVLADDRLVVQQFVEKRYTDGPGQLELWVSAVASA